MRDTAADKEALRRTMRTRRDALPRAFVVAASRAVTDGVTRLPRFTAAREILAYLPIRGEADPTALVEAVLARGGRLLLPRCRKDRPGELDLGCVSCLADVAPGSFGIPEPRPDLCRPPGDFSPDVILVPGLAFDAGGVRLGFGGGYYDRLLALPMAAGAYVVGLAYDFQLVPRLPAEPWDRPMDAVVTELRTHRITP